MKPDTTKRLFPIRRKRVKTPNPSHVCSLLEKIASEEKGNTGRYNLMMEVVALIRTAYPNRSRL